MEMLTSLNILAGKISPQNHDDPTGSSAASGDHSPSNARYFLIDSFKKTHSFYYANMGAITHLEKSWTPIDHATLNDVTGATLKTGQMSSSFNNRSLIEMWESRSLVDYYEGALMDGERSVGRKMRALDRWRWGTLCSRPLLAVVVDFYAYTRSERKRERDCLNQQLFPVPRVRKRIDKSQFVSGRPDRLCGGGTNSFRVDVRGLGKRFTSCTEFGILIRLRNPCCEISAR